MNNFEEMYEKEKELRRQLKQDYDEYQEKSAEIEDYLESQIILLKQTLAKKDQDFQDFKLKQQQTKTESDTFIRQLEREVDSLRQKQEQAQENNKKDRIKIVQLENETEYLESQNRVLETLNNDLEQKIDSILEELAFLQTELEENKNNHQNDIENIERLKQQIRDTESELFAQQMKQQMAVNQENIQNLSNYNDTRNTIQNNNNHSRDEVCEESDKDNKLGKQKSIKQQNASNSLDLQQADTQSKLHTNLNNKHQQDRLNKYTDQNNNQSCSISQKDSSSNNSSGKKEDSGKKDDNDSFGSEQQQRGRKLNSFTGFKAERYSEEKRRLQHKIIKDKIIMYDKNISNLKVTEHGFSKSLNFITNLINDLDDKMVNIRNKKAQLGTPRNMSAAKKIQITAQ